MQFVQPERDRFPIPPERKLERVVDPPVVVFLLFHRLSLRCRCCRRRLCCLPSLELFNLRRALSICESGPALRVG